jgi:hypothetical protein
VFFNMDVDVKCGAGMPRRFLSTSHIVFQRFPRQRIAIQWITTKTLKT